MNKLAVNSKLSDKSISEIIVENKEYIYPSLCYIAGLLLGSFLFSYSNLLSDIIKPLLTVSTGSYFNLFINRFAVYISVYSATVLLGLCLIGFPFINTVPFMCGIEIGMKIAFYYVSYSIKGIGFSLLMIIPESAAFITILILAIKISSSLSRGIYNNTVKKEDTIEEVNLKSYLKSYIIYALILAVIAAVNALATYLLSSIIQI